MSTGGLSRTRLGRMHEVMAGHVERGEVPGLVTLVDRRGEVHVDAIGTLAFGGDAPMRRDTIFRIASMTKPVTAAAAMILVEECRLRLDDPVDRLLPELADRRVLTRHRRAARRHRAGEPADHAARPADLPPGLRRGHGASPNAYPIQKAMEEAGRRSGPVPAARRRRTSGCAARHAAADAPAGRAVAVRHRLRHARRADRARLGPAARRRSCASASSSRSA